MNLQAMDSSHVSLCSLLLKTEAFEAFRCDRNVSVGLNLANMTKIVKCAGNDDSITIKTGDKSDTVSFVFEVEFVTTNQSFNRPDPSMNHKRGLFFSPFSP